jgi:HEAT repeat protein
MTTENPQQPKVIPEELQLRPLVSEFVVALVKSIQLSSQYAPDHPEVKRSVAALHHQFQVLLQGNAEITFLAKIGGDSKDVILDGIFGEPVNLPTVMPHGAGDLFLPKLREIFDRRRLLTCSIKADIPLGEFEGFLTILSTFAGPAGDRGANVPAETAKWLLERGISHVSLVFVEELVGRDRQLPWRVEMALTRLRKDLRVIPLYRKSGPAEMKRAKAQVIDDIIRPVRRPDLLKAILVNCDLISQDLAAAGQEAIELEIIGRLPAGMVGPTALDLAKDLEGSGPAGEASRRERAKDILKSLVARLTDKSTPEGDRVLTHLFERKLLSLEELPARLQEAIAAKEFADTFLTHEPQHLDRLHALGDDPGAAAPYARIIPELIRREKYPVALTILRAIESRSGEGSPSSEGFRALLEGIRATAAEGDLIQTLVERFRTASAGIRQKLVEVLPSLGRSGVPPLVDMLATTEDAELRRHLIAGLAQIGAGALDDIRVVLERPDLCPRTARNLLAALAQIGGPEAASATQRFLHHPDASVREEAVAAIAKISGSHAEAELLGVLKDSAPAVRRRALVCLGAMGSSNPRVVDFLCEVIRKRRKDEPEEDPHLQVQACQALAEVCRVTPSLSPRIEALMIQALDLDGGKRLLGLWGGAAGKSDAVRATICTALGQIGGQESAAALRRLAGDKTLLVRDKAARALRQLEARPAPRSA